MASLRPARPRAFRSPSMHFRMSRRPLLKYLSVALALVVLAGLEFAREYWSGEAPDAALCLTPESRKEAIKEVLLHQMRGH